MKNMLLIAALFVTTPAIAQDKIECRPLVANDFVAPNETLVGSGSNTMVCHVVAPAKPQAQTLQPQVAPAQVAPTQPAAASQPPASPAVTTDQSQATIYFYRPRRFQGSALKPTVFVDDARAGRLHNGDSINIVVAPGPHRVYSNDKSTGIELDAKPGQTYFVRVDIQVGLLKGHGGVTLVDPQQGKYEVAQAAHQGDH
jgi:hypothetical protein